MDSHLFNLVVNKGKRPELPSGTPSRAMPLIQLMRRCWVHYPKKRPTFEAIVAQLKPLAKRVATAQADRDAQIRRQKELRQEQPRPIAQL